MIGRVRSLGLSGLNGYEVGVECFLSGGLPSFDIVGLPDTAVKESRERVRAAAKNSDLVFPQRRITVNLTPADKRKEGSVYDLPIMLCVASAQDSALVIPDDAAFLGELSLTGELRPVNGVLSMALAARSTDIKTIFVPKDNAREAALAQGLEVFGIKTVRELVRHLTGERVVKPETARPPEIPEIYCDDFRDVRGQENVKRALEIAAAGAHNIIMSGPPGSGKSMLAQRLPSILPALTYDEILECTQIYSVAKLLTASVPLVTSRPFRSPHHTVSGAGLSGGGSNPRPGEISLAHNGVLFLDELPEFPRDSLEVLRQPMEDGTITISRAAAAVSYPARFMLVAAMNPCKCGWHGHESWRCTCTARSLEQYRARISGPLLDRIDMHVNVRHVEYTELVEPGGAESSAVIRERVGRARDIQRSRYGEGFYNATLPAELREKFCKPDSKGSELLESAFSRLGLTARSYDRIVKVARTIADLAGSESIESGHIAEAVQYRRLDRV
ncbi:MAG: YifB family Mg chelatase-like AAA ATPase [Oscillospiraceae bacterium]|nr:YifB family Mg chelatase-like AAA ATPase [Oscillospiraceae bacterium]